MPAKPPTPARENGGAGALTTRRAILLLVLAAALLRASTWSFEFIYDDRFFLFEQPAVGPDAGPRVWFGEPVHGLYRPVRSIAQWAAARAFGPSPAPYHVLASALDAAFAVALLLFLARLVPLGPALAGAMAWLVHPAHVSRAVWITAGFDLIGPLLAMAALIVAVDGDREPSDGASRVPRSGTNAGARWVAFLAIATVAYFASEEALLLPVFIALVFAHRHGARAAVRDRRRFTILTAALLPALAYLAARVLVVGDVARPTATGELARVGAPEALAVFGFYVARALAPFGLREVDRPYRFDGFAHAPVLLGAALLVAFAVLAIVGLARRRGWGLAAGWWLAALLPFSNLVPNTQDRALRYLTVPVAALAIAVAFAARALAAKPERERRAAAALSLLVAAVLAAQTVRFSAIYRDDPTLWREAYRACPTCTKAAINHGMQLAKQGRLDEAEAVLTPMLKPIRGYEAAYVAMAAVQADRGRMEDASVMARTALTIAPEDRRVRAMARRLGLDLDEPAEGAP